MNIYGRLKDWQANWNELENQINNCTTDCEHFGMKVPEMGGYKKIKAHMES